MRMAVAAGMIVRRTMLVSNRTEEDEDEEEQQEQPCQPRDALRARAPNNPSITTFVSQRSYQCAAKHYEAIVTTSQALCNWY